MAQLKMGLVSEEDSVLILQLLEKFYDLSCLDSEEKEVYLHIHIIIPDRNVSLEAL